MKKKKKINKIIDKLKKLFHIGKKIKKISNKDCRGI